MNTQSRYLVSGMLSWAPTPPPASMRLGLADDKLIVELNSAGKTVSVLVADGSIAGLIAMRDEPERMRSKVCLLSDSSESKQSC